MRRSILHSPRIEELKKKKRKILKTKIIFFFCCFLVILVGLVFLSRWKRLNIDNIQVSGNKVLEISVIEKIVKENITGDYFWVFPKTNFILYPQHKIENDLKNKLKRIKSTTVNNKNIRSLEIVISEYEGGYTWCGNTIPASTEDMANQKCYFMDSTGYIFDEAPYFSGNVYFRFYGPVVGNSNSDNPSGKYFLKNNFNQIINFKKSLEEFSLKPEAFWLEDDANISLSSNIINGPKIIFKLDSNYQKVTENLQAAISTEPLKNKMKTKLSSLLYLDLRFGNKVYYKFNE